MIVTFGTVVPKGHLPCYSVDSEQEAKDLLILACGTNLQGQFVARELAEEQTLENLWAFGRRLAKTHAWMQKKRRNLKEKFDGGK